MSLGAFLLARFDNPTRRKAALDAVGRSPEIKTWHAVEGPYHLLARTVTTVPPLPAGLEALGEPEVWQICEVSQEASIVRPIQPGAAHAYVLIESEPEKTAAVAAALEALPAVRSCATTRGAWSLVAFLEGESFRALDRVVTEGISSREGVLRLKQSRVINLQQL